MTIKATPTRFPYIKKETEKGKDPVWHYRRTRVNPVTGKRQEWDRKFPSETEAREYGDQVNAEIAEGTPVKKRGGMTVSEACDQYFVNKRGLDPHTVSNYATVLLPLRGAYPELPITHLTEDHLIALLDICRSVGWVRADGRQGVPYKATSANTLLRYTGMMIRNVMGKKFDNPADYVEREKSDRKERPTLTKAQAEHLLEVTQHDQWRVAWRLGLYGLRRGEIAGLRWEDVDYTKGTITINRARVVEDKPYRIIIKNPKTEKSTRTLPMSASLMMELQAAQEVIALNRSMMEAHYTDSGYVVVGEDGIEPSPEVITDHWKRSLKKAGLPTINLHDARHTCTTLLFQEGMPQTEIARWLGHANTSMLALYGHSQTAALMALGTSGAANL